MNKHNMDIGDHGQWLCEVPGSDLGYANGQTVMQKTLNHRRTPNNGKTWRTQCKQ